MRIDAVWDVRRGYAKQARAMKAQATFYHRAALACALLAAVMAFVALLPVPGVTWHIRLANLLGAAAMAAAAVFGKEVLTNKLEEKWLAARGLAETLTTECFRYAGHAAHYTGDDVTDGQGFAGRVGELLAQSAKAGLTSPEFDQVNSSTYQVTNGVDPRCPAQGMTADWYLSNRLRDQCNWYIAAKSANDRAGRRLRWIGLAVALAAAFSGLAGAARYEALGQWGFAPAALLGMLITVGTAIAAYGLLDHRASLAATYGAAAMQLQLVDSAQWNDATLPQLVDTTEALLAAEQGIWAVHIGRNLPAQAPSPEPPAQTGEADQN